MYIPLLFRYESQCPAFWCSMIKKLWNRPELEGKAILLFDHTFVSIKFLCTIP